MENYIAIDNVCAWPNLTPMPDGSITAVIFSQPTHGRWQGDVECWGSEDEGCTWSLRGVPAPHEAGTVRLNVAVGLAGDGALVVIAAGFDKRPPAGQVVDPQDVIPLPLWVCRSQDGGPDLGKRGECSATVSGLGSRSDALWRYHRAGGRQSGGVAVQLASISQPRVGPLLHQPRRRTRLGVVQRHPAGRHQLVISSRSKPVSSPFRVGLTA